ncbi:hypothetical protein Patl1_20703 [Pistacia atlantica]|uniref:Uncharacterized protein n=1 Tax=Pistacia atlantica TaxID=434234 RepID=A0ACC1BHH5_9ROSI|nr:hypothetical protein Patl1_20703 [Pistacia atlantica]
MSVQGVKLDTSITRAISLAEEIANNDDLLTELLIRLPIKSSVKFKSVSKHWLSLISNPHFSVRLSLVPRLTAGLFLRNVDSTEYDFINLASSSPRAPFKLLTLGDESSQIMVLQSCNGLLLCCSLKAQEFARFLDFNFFENYYVFNPTTKKYKMLPPLPARTGVFRAVPGIFLAFDPSKSPHYKVICVRSIYDSLEDTRFEMLIYSSKTGGWQVSVNTFLGPFSLTLLGGVYWNGAIHWINFWQKSLYLDVEEEEVREMPMPPIPDGYEDRIFCYFGESGGHLHLVEIYNNLSVLFNVFEMEKDYSKWFVKYQVDLRGIATAYPEMLFRNYVNPDSFRYSILCLVREEYDDDSYVVLHLSKKAIRYNLKEKTFETLHQFAPSGSKIRDKFAIQYIWSDAFQHIESLACVW